MLSLKGKKETKQLNEQYYYYNSVSLIHFVARGNYEIGKIALALSRTLY